MAKSCKWCDSTEHTQFYCRQKPNKPINKVGRVGRETNAAVKKWKTKQKPTHGGYFICYICGRYVQYLTAEHVKSKVRRPDLRANETNFQPTCNPCNEAKGST